VGRALFLVALVALAVLTVVLVVSAVRDNSRVSAFRRHGVPVVATVTGCRGVGSGIGDGIQYWVCRGNYTLAGQTYNEVIDGSRSELAVGQQVQAVAVPGRPSLLSTASALASAHTSSAAYVTPAVLGCVTLVMAVAFVLWSRRTAARDRLRAGGEQPAES
jgi:hypothetical protein